MTIQAALSIAQSGIADISNQIAVLSQNVANAGTANYATEIAGQVSVGAEGQGMGVAIIPTTLVTDTAVQNQALLQNGVVSGLNTTSNALSSVNTALGATASGDDLSSQLGTLQSAFSTLENDPGSQVQQDQVVTDAENVAGTINNMASTYTQVRQTAQDNLVTQVASLNTNLATIGSLSQQIVTLQQQGLSTADLENQRATAMAAVSQLVSVKFYPQANGGLQAYTSGGQYLPLTGGTPFSISPATIGTSTTAAGTSAGDAPPILLNGTADVTSSMTGGSIGANVTLRDTTLPTYQAELDEFSAALANRFSTQGLNLFTDAAGAVPALSTTAPVQSNYVGFSASIQVNPGVLASPSAVRDGYPTSLNTSSDAGYTGVISNVLNYTFGADVSASTAQPAMNTTGLGESGTLSAPFSPQTTLGDAATTLVASQAQDSGNATTALTTQQQVQTALQTQISGVTGVSIDAQMSLMEQLQNAYSANAKIISAAVQMWNDLVAATASTTVN